MSLERFLYGRLVVLGPDATAFQAARAMDDNAIGTVLVANRWGLVGIVTDRDLVLNVLEREEDPHTITVGDVMTGDIETLPYDATIEDAVHVMRSAGIRRIPLLGDHGKPVGIVSLDDLIVERLIPLEAAAEILRAQLSEPARNKARGAIRPGRVYEAPRNPLARREAHADATYSRFVHAVAERTGLGKMASAERAARLVVGMLCQRIVPNLARHFLSQLPVVLTDGIVERLDGPLRSVTGRAIESRLERALDVSPDRARAIVAGVARVLEETVSPGQIATMCDQLPPDLRGYFGARRGTQRSESFGPDTRSIGGVER